MLSWLSVIMVCLGHGMHRCCVGLAGGGSEPHQYGIVGVFRCQCRLAALAMLVFFSFPAGVGSAAQATDVLPSSPSGGGAGEQLVFQLRWGVVPAGEATLQVMPVAKVNNAMAHHFVMTAQTNPFVDFFYKVRDRIDAYTDLGVTRSVWYKKDQQEGSTRRKIDVQFDWLAHEVHYTNFGKTRPPLAIQPGTFDPLSVFYYVRQLDLQEGGVYERPVTDGKKTLVGRVTVVGRETIQVPAGIFETFKLAPDLRDLGGVFEKSRQAKLFLWVTTDARHTLVMLQSKVVVGSFVAELTSLQQAAIDPQPEAP